MKFFAPRTMSAASATNMMYDQSIVVHKGPILYVPPDGDGMVVSSGWMIGEEAEVAIRCDHHQERSLVPPPAKKGEMTRVLQLLLMALSSFSSAFPPAISFINPLVFMTNSDFASYSGDLQNFIVSR